MENERSGRQLLSSASLVKNVLFFLWGEVVVEVLDVSGGGSRGSKA
ncbi:MAG: hypothetical protein IJR32_01610 [Paludibacteraceae bacterium]|nr:hypothetical protein [Paludibacteraceae bacterium]